MTSRNLNSLDDELLKRVDDGRTSKDVKILVFLHQRLMLVHGESNLYDYMHGLRDIITKLDAADYVSNIP